MEGSVLSFLKAEWKVSDTGSAPLVKFSSNCNAVFYSVQLYKLLLDHYFFAILFQKGV
jgi:hypothetical protein